MNSPEVGMVTKAYQTKNQRSPLYGLIFEVITTRKNLGIGVVLKVVRLSIDFYFRVVEIETVSPDEMLLRAVELESERMLSKEKDYDIKHFENRTIYLPIHPDQKKAIMVDRNLRDSVLGFPFITE